MSLAYLYQLPRSVVHVERDSKYLNISKIEVESTNIANFLAHPLAHTANLSHEYNAIDSAKRLKMRLYIFRHSSNEIVQLDPHKGCY